MPWCDTCGRFYNPNSLRPDGTCPTCGRQVAPPGDARTEAAVGTAEEELTTPWHFKLLVLAVVVYLGWRLVEGIVWVAQRF